MGFRVCNALKIKPFQALLRSILFCSLGEVGARGRATAKPNASRRSSADDFAVRMKRTKAGAGLSNPVPRFRRRNGNGKNPDGQGFKSGDFFAPFAKKYYSSLDGLDSRNGRRTGIAFRNRLWYNFPQYKPINRNYY